MTNPTLTQAEIDAMEQRQKEWEACGKPEGGDYAYYAGYVTGFIPKAIARIRELEDRVRQLGEDLPKFVHFQESHNLLATEYEKIKEQTRWRHIDQEQPEDGQCVLLWKPLEQAMTFACFIQHEMSWGCDFVGYNLNCSAFPHWHPLPTKGPDQ